jgi:crotonobetaine/carnitine-CoA ligase
MRTYNDLRPTFEDQRTWTLPWILRERARTHGASIYLDTPFQNHKFTYAQTLDAAERIASGLLAHGGEPGDRVLIMAPNCSEVIFGWFGTAFAGMVEVPINTAYEGSFLEHQVRTTAPRAALLAPEFVERFLVGKVEAYASIERYYLLEAGTPEHEAAAAALRAAGHQVHAYDELAEATPGELPEVRFSDPGSIIFTSGTTGLSKGVTMPHAHLVLFAEEAISITRLTDQDAYMSVGPLFHGNAQFLAAYPALIKGARFVLQAKFSTSGWIDQIRDSGATVTNFVGVMMDFASKADPRPDDADNQLRCVFAAPTPASLLEPFRERFGIEAFVEGFGLTETCMPFLAPYGESRPAGAAGLLVEDFFEARLVDPETDLEVPVGEVGELIVRSKLPWTSLTNYWGMPDKTAEVFRNLWFHTGDGLRRDEDGWYYFVDRLKDALRRRGENISSFEIEQAVLDHDEISECAAVAAPAAARGGEDEVAIFVVLAAGASLTEEELSDWAAQRLPSFARPEYVFIVDGLPMNPAGKVRKLELRAVAEAAATERNATLTPR